jgi:flagellin FlaB
MGGLLGNKKASMGIGSMIIFIAMILVAGVTASVMIQTMNSLQQQAMKTGEETVRDISGGLKVTHVTGYNNGSKITQIAIFLVPLAGSGDINMTYVDISLSDTTSHVLLSCNSSCFSSNISNGLFNTLNASNLTANTYGVMVVRDIDGSCSSTTLTINDEDLIVLLVNTSKCFSGISTRTEIFGDVIPEYGISGIISFTTPSAYINIIIDLQP